MEFTTGFIWSFFRNYPTRLLFGLAALLISSGSLLSIPKVLGYFVDQNIINEDWSGLHLAAAILTAVITLYAATAALRGYMLSWLGERFVTDIRSRIYNHLLDLPMTFFETHPTGDLLSRLSSDVAVLETMVSIVIPIGLRSFIQLIGAVFLMILIDWQLAGLVILIGPLLAWIALTFGRRVRKAASWSRQGEALVVTQIEKSLNAIATIKAFTGESIEKKRFRSASEDNFSASEKLMRTRALFLFIVFFFALNIGVAILYAGAHKVLNHTMSWSMVTQFLIYVSVAAFSFAGLSEIFSEIKKTSSSAERLFHILMQMPEGIKSGSCLPVPSGKGELIFQAVTFAYPARLQQPALQDFNLSIQPGEMVALVGPSGAGKTTVLRLLLRLYDPQTGSISLDEADLRSLDPYDLRRRIAIVTQEPVIFSGTVYENILYGNPDATEEQIIMASKLAQAHEFIMHLPSGYSTELGEKGQQLSTGQRQRLAIARALVRQPRILLLDEATSSLDAENESLLQKTFTEYLRGQTMIVVAHRLATVQAADRVIVINNGCIQGHGTHSQLLKTNSLYARLVAKEFEQTNIPAND